MFNITSKDNNLYNLDTLKIGNSLLRGFTFTEFKGDLGNLTEAKNMFYECKQLETFTADLHSLRNGRNMFYGCTSLTKFQDESGAIPNLDNLVDAKNMFRWGPIFDIWNRNLPNLVDGESMFMDMQSLETFVADMPKLTITTYMFRTCKNLTNFIVNISSPNLKGLDISASKITPNSVLSVLESSAPNVSATFALGVGIVIKDADGNALSGEEQQANKDAFAQEIGFETFNDLIQAFRAKSKTVNWTFNGSPTSSNTLDMGGLPVPIYAKLEESSEEMAEYCTEDGEKFYNIIWCHQPHDPSEWNYFGSLLEACGYWGVIPKEYLEK